jgi:hypothetical protein
MTPSSSSPAATTPDAHQTMCPTIPSPASSNGVIYFSLENSSTPLLATPQTYSCKSKLRPSRGSRIGGGLSVGAILVRADFAEDFAMTNLLTVWPGSVYISGADRH